MRVCYAVATILMICTYTLPLSATVAAAPHVTEITSWRDLECPHDVTPGQGAMYYTFPLENGTKAHVVVIDLTAKNWRILPAISDKTRATSETAASNNASAAINGGYFNLSDGVSASYIVCSGKELANPRTNKALIGNPKLQPHLQKIFDRSEIRFLVNNETAKSSIEIARHSVPIPPNVTLRDALQAGPQLLPILTAAEEAFVRTEPDGTTSDSIGTKKLAARTAFGVTGDNHAIMLTVAGKGQEDGSSGLTLAQLADLMKKLGCVQAINLDGGASTTMFVKTASTKGSVQPQSGVATDRTVCGKHPETRVKSILMLRPVQ